MIKAIIFDFDGTLSNRKANAYGVAKDYFRPFFKDYNDLEYEAVLQDFLVDDCNGTISVEYRMAPFINKYKDHFTEADFASFKEFYYQYMWKYAVLKPETIEVLEKLRKLGYKLAIYSNGQSKSQHDKIDYVNLPQYFDYVLVGGDINISKPKKEGFDYIASKLNVSNEECLFVGDVYSSDILGAIRSNMVPVWLLTDYEIPHDYYKGIVINNLQEIFKVLDNIYE